MKVLLAHPGTQHAPRLARELERLGLLGEFWTGLAFAERSLAGALLRIIGPRGPFAGLNTRIVRGLPASRLHTSAALEYRAIRRLRRGEDSILTLHARNEAFQRRIPDRALAAHAAVIGFDTSSWLLAERCRQIGRPFYLDRTIAHPAALAKIAREFNRQHSEWTVPGTERPPAVRAAEAAEHALASRIVVAGRFARETLIADGVAADKIVVNPYGVDWDAFAGPAAAAPVAAGARPFRFLFVGSVTARKGIPVLLAAWQRLALRDAELWIVGGIGRHERNLIPDLPGLRLLGQTPRAALPALYAQADVFVLPSLFEGFGLVLLEALAAGLPIISTPHTGAADLLPNEPLGQLVAAGSVDELAAAMQHQHAHPPDRARVLAASASLREYYSWEAYGRRWAGLLPRS